MAANYTIVIEHLDPEMGPWSTLEYQAIAKESEEAGFDFLLAGVSEDVTVPDELSSMSGFTLDNRSTETIYKSDRDRVCLLDPRAETELSPEDTSEFDAFLFGGILGMSGIKKCWAKKSNGS